MYIKTKFNSHYSVIQHRIIFLLAFSIILFNDYSAQSKYNLAQFGNESAQFVQLPLKWDSSDWGMFGLTAASTYLLTRIDNPIKEELQKELRFSKSVPVELGRMWGEIYPTAIIGGGFGLYGLMANDNYSKRIGYEIYQTAFYAGMITTILKASTGRARPFTNDGSNFYKPFSIFDDDFHSLPSGHVTMAFALSTVLSKNSKSDLLKILCYVPAVLTTFSRVYQNKHWTSDVFLGAAVGYFVGSWVHKQHEEKDPTVSFFQNPYSLVSIRF